MHTAGHVLILHIVSGCDASVRDSVEEDEAGCFQRYGHHSCNPVFNVMYIAANSGSGCDVLDWYLVGVAGTAACRLCTLWWDCGVGTATAVLAVWVFTTI
jgi:hypothetical protein